MKYIFDFDRTLFDTDRFKADSAEYREDNAPVTLDIFERINPRGYLFDDVVSFLSSIPKENLGVLTVVREYLGATGEAFQRGKVEGSGVSELVLWCEYMQGEKGSFVENHYDGSPTVFIDDEKGQIDSVRKRCPDVVCIQLVRSESLYEAALSVADGYHVAKDFAEVTNVLKSYE